MLMRDIISKKRGGYALSTEELNFVIQGYTAGTIPDYQISALLMAVCFQGMTRDETLDLTMAMLHSGDTLDLSSVSGVTADKHSTGGIGDKTSLALIPMMAALGIKMAKMSGRGLGFTGGTIDKLESIPGVKTSISSERFVAILDKINCVIAESTVDLAPADKKLYALRDVTGTVESIPLIVSSIMSKKLAAGSDVIVLDVKTGGGSFMKTPAAAKELAREMVEIGRMAGRKTAALITDMDEPLGFCVGNALEVKEAVQILRGETRGGNLLELCLSLGSVILTLCNVFSDQVEARDAIKNVVQSGAAFEKFCELITELGGDVTTIRDMSLLPVAPVVIDVPSLSSGFVASIDAEGVGEAVLRLGGGRVDKNSVIDPAVGVILLKKRGDSVSIGENLAQIHASTSADASDAAVAISSCYEISRTSPEHSPFIIDLFVS